MSEFKYLFVANNTDDMVSINVYIFFSIFIYTYTFVESNILGPTTIFFQIHFYLLLSLKRALRQKKKKQKTKQT